MIHQYISATVGLKELSNLFECQIKGNVPISQNTYVFPSAEHYYVAHFCGSVEQVNY
jgi:hypothetical protein